MTATEPQAGASARPWRVGPPHTLWRTYTDGDVRMHRPIAEFFDVPSASDGASREANAAFALRAINSLDPLVAALTTLRAKFHRALVIGGTDPEFADVACEQADAALRLAAPAPAQEVGR